jgi:hypothetical protein
MDRLDVIRERLGGRGTYLEIGVAGGQVFWNVQADTRIGVDPAFGGRKLNWLAKIMPAKRKLGRRGTLLYRETSDQFFGRAEVRSLRLDCVLVDGLHTADQAYRDVQHALELLTPSGLIVMHDCNPQTETAALPSRDDARARPDYNKIWNGNVWQAVVRLRTRSDVRVRVLDADHGLGLVTHGQPDDVLALSLAEIEQLTYAEFAADRRHLLNLVPDQPTSGTALDTTVHPDM